MSKLPKEKRDKIILVGMATVVASAAIWLLLIKTQFNTLRTTREQAVTAHGQLQRGQATLLTKAKTSEDFDAASKQLREKETAMAAPNDMYSWLIQTLNNFRSNHRGVEIPQFGPPQPSEVGVFAKFPFHAAVFNVRGTAYYHDAAVFNVRGTAYYHDLGKFLADFENTFPFMRVQNIELEPASEGPAGQEAREKLSFKLELLTLVKPAAL
jgi:hypothetical protein